MLRTVYTGIVCGALFTLGATASAQAPTMADVRAQLEATGMSPSEIDQVLASIPMAPSAVVTVPAPACADENQNDVCDDEENDPQVTECRKTYLNIIESKARKNYGTRLGETAMRISQTCSTAAAGGTMYIKPSDGSSRGSREYNTDQLFKIAGYWNEVLAYARYLEPTEVELDIDDENIDSIIAGFPRDLRALLQNAGGDGNDFYETALPIHERCEKIRGYVGQSYRASVHHNTICLPAAPELAPIDDQEGDE